MEDALDSRSDEPQEESGPGEREVSVAELAAEWGVSEVTVRRYIRQGRLRTRGGAKRRGQGYRILLRPGQVGPDPAGTKAAADVQAASTPTQDPPSAPVARPPSWSRARTGGTPGSRDKTPPATVPHEVLAETAAAERHAAELIQMQRERRQQEREARERERRRQARREAQAAREAAERAAREVAAREAATAQEVSAEQEAMADLTADDSPAESEQEVGSAVSASPPEPVVEESAPAVSAPAPADSAPVVRHTLRRAEWWERGTEAEPRSGCLTVLVELQSPESIGLPVGPEQFRLSDEAGAEYEPIALRQPALRSIDLERSAWTRGWITFWAPRDAPAFELEYSPVHGAQTVVYRIENPASA